MATAKSEHLNRLRKRVGAIVADLEEKPNEWVPGPGKINKNRIVWALELLADPSVKIALDYLKANLTSTKTGVIEPAGYSEPFRKAG